MTREKRDFRYLLFIDWSKSIDTKYDFFEIVCCLCSNSFSHSMSTLAVSDIAIKDYELVNFVEKSKGCIKDTIQIPKATIPI